MFRKIAVYIAFVVACLTVAFAFVTASTYVQLASAAVLYPLLSYAALKLFPRKEGVMRVVSSKNSQDNNSPAKGEFSVGSPSTEVESVESAEKREFLKLIGIAGATYFVFSVLNKRAEAAFFSKAFGQPSIKIEDSEGNPINPAQEQPTDGYQISDLDEYDSDFIYYGCTKQDGTWYIMRQDPYTGSFRYIKGDLEYPANWETRQNLSYDYYYNVFTQ